MEIAVICGGLGQKKHVFKLLCQCCNEQLTDIHTGECSCYWNGVFTRFITYVESEQYLRGRRNVSIVYAEWLIYALEDLLERKKQQC